MAVIFQIRYPRVLAGACPVFLICRAGRSPRRRRAMRGRRGDWARQLRSGADTIKMDSMAIQLPELAAPEMDEQGTSARPTVIKLVPEFFP